MFDNPFAWIVLLLNLSMFVILIGLKLDNKKRCLTFCKLHCGVGAACRFGFPPDCLRSTDGQSLAIRNDNLQFPVMANNSLTFNQTKKPNIMKTIILFLLLVLELDSFAKQYADSLVTISVSELNELLSIRDTTISKKKLEDLVEKSKNTNDSLWIGIIGGADIQKIIGKSEDNIPANLSLGIVYKQLFSNDNDLKLLSDIYTQTYINLSQTYDTIKAEYAANGSISNLSQYGDFLLLPTNSKYSASAYFTGYFYRNSRKLNNSKIGLYDIIFGTFNGIHGEAAAGQKVFTFDSINYSTVGLSLRLGLFHEFIPKDIRLKKNYSIIFGVDFSQRHIFGDLGQNVNDEFRKTNLGTDKKSFFGVEPYLNFRFENLFIEVTVPNLWQKHNEDIPGLTMTRFILKVKFVGSLPLSIK